MTVINRTRFKAALFDLDGLLLNTEDIFNLAVKRVLAKKFNIDGPTFELISKVQGSPFVPKSAGIIIDYYKLNKTNASNHKQITPEELYELINDEQTDLYGTAALLPGTIQLVEKLKQKGIPIAICTSSQRWKFEAKTGHLPEFFNYFEGKVITGDDERLGGRGKPLPDIWFLGVELLNEKSSNEEKIKIEDCLIFEDSINGFRSGKAAGGFVIWVPDKEVLHESLNQEEITQMVGSNNEHGFMFDSLADFDLDSLM